MATAAAPAPSVLEAALAYAARGWPIFPCDSQTKAPLTKNGLHDASTNPSAIRAWWRHWPEAMVAAPTGPAIGAWVLDVDEPAATEAAFASLGLALPATRRGDTGKGYHLHFAWDDADPIRNAQRHPRKGWPFPELPGAEVRGAGGYVILAPSLHPSGRRYAWARDEEPTEAPEELLRIVRKAAAKPAPEPADPLAEVFAKHGNTMLRAGYGGQDHPYCLAALKAECDLIEAAGNGEQEAALNDGALKIGHYVGAGLLAFQTASSRLIAAGLSMPSYNPNNPWTPEIITTKVVRGLQDGMRDPKSPPPLELRVVSSKGSSAGEDGDRPVIAVRAGCLAEMATQAEDALISGGAPFYIRGGLVRPVVDEVPAAHGRLTKVARLVAVDADMVVDHLARVSDWVKFNVRKNEDVPTDPPHNVAATVLSRDGEWRFPKLAGVITTPTLRPDGTILSEPGYDPATRLLLLDPPTLPPIADRPTREDACAALNVLSALLEGFPFVDDASRAVALSGFITPVVRGAMPVAPLHATGAPVAGSGKSYLIDIASAIHTGERAPVIAAGRNEEETEKRLGAALLNGQPIVTIDNVNGVLGGDALCQMIERPVVSVRPLGVSKLVKVESRATIFATGNNIAMLGDMTRRVVLCSLDPNMERPELRAFATNPFDQVMADRGKYVAAALTIARAYIVAGRPGKLPPLASFEAWSDIVRSALVWLGCADPIETMEAARADDPELSKLSRVMLAWYDAVNSSARSAGDIKKLAERRGPDGDLENHELHLALFDVADDRRGAIGARQLGQFLARYKGRIFGDLKLVAEMDTHSKQQIWRVSRV